MNSAGIRGTLLTGMLAVAFMTGCATTPSPTGALKRSQLLPLSYEYDERGDEEEEAGAALAGEAVGPLPGDKYKPGCAIPFRGAKHRSVSRVCSIEGDAEAPGAALEYQQKNFLCATGTPVDITLQDFRLIQSRTEAKAAAEHFPFMRGHTDYIADRTPLKSIAVMNGKSVGEGTFVRLVAFVVRARTMNTAASASGESVNCHLTGAAYNDIHIDLGIKPEAEPCEGVVVEMIPHYRPASWTDENLRLLASPVRITGPLFADNRHKLRLCGQTSNQPPRFSVWEIHPVYSIDVCKNEMLNDCSASDNSVWLPFDEWAALP